MSESAASRRIVPDVEQSVSAQHLRYRKGPAIWPVWLALVAISGLFAAAAAGLWYERERLLEEISGLSGEVSNMHARLDSGDTQIEEAISLLQAQMSTLFQEQEQLGTTMNDTRRELLSLIPASEDTVSADALIELTQQIKAQQQAGAENERLVTDFEASLAAVEQNGSQGREQLKEEIANLASRFQDQQDNLTKSITVLEEQQLAIQNRVQVLDATDKNADIVTSSEMSQQLATTRQSLQEELNALESDLRQIRQAQLAFSAQLEMLR